jgi:hypothetical protein
MLRAIATAKKKNDRIDAGKMAEWCLQRSETDAANCGTGTSWYGRWCG